VGRGFVRSPVVLEVKTDPEVPPLPPHITLDQAKKFSHSAAKGDPHAASLLTGAAQLLSAALPESGALSLDAAMPGRRPTALGMAL
jgi:hypothetical protein